MYTHELYNRLPSLHEARTHLYGLEGGPEPLLKSLAPIFKYYPHLGICLVHAHCELVEGEKMVSSGRVSQPESGDEQCFPERWLSNGIPYEFSRTSTIAEEELPPSLVKDFRTRLEQYGKEKLGGEDLNRLLGIYYVHDPDALHLPSGETVPAGQAREDIVWMERTEGRKNIVEPVPRAEAAKVPNLVPAAWFVLRVEQEIGDGSLEMEEDWGLAVIQGCVCIDMRQTHARPPTGGGHTSKKSVNHHPPIEPDNCFALCHLKAHRCTCHDE
jgi:hypothetical protein